LAPRSTRVVAVDDAPVEVVQVGSGEAAAVEGHQRPELGWNHRDHIEDHPFRLVARLAEGIEHLQPFGILDAFLRRGVGLHLLAHLVRGRRYVHALQKLLDGFGSHAGAELSRVLLLELPVAVLGEHLALLERSLTGVNDDILLEVEHLLEVAQRDVEEVADAARQALEKPHVGAGRGQLDVAQALAAHLGERHFHAALVANHSPVLHALVFAAQALPVGHRTKNAGAEKAVALRLEGAVVDGFRFGHFTVRPGTDLFRRGQADPDAVELANQADSVIRAASKQFVSSLRELRFLVCRVASGGREPSLC
jgi:hypothetical protein